MNGADVRDLAPSSLPQAAEELLHSGGRMQMVYALPVGNALELRYVTAPGAGQAFELWRVRPDGDPPSLAVIWPLLGWYEREVMDLHDIRFAGHPEPRPLLTTTQGAAPGDLPEVDGTAVQELPFGPIRADVLESAEFVFVYVGELIIHYEPSLFRKRRGMERCFEGRTALHGVVLAERVSGVGSLSHALAYCEAVERAAGCTVPPRAKLWRVILAELERIYNHLHYLGHLSHTTTLKVGEAQGKLLEEHAKAINGRLTGSRFLRSLLAPGGLRRDLTGSDWLPAALEALRDEVERYVKLLQASESHLDRLISTGALSAKVAFDQGATGPVERASGVDRDLRRDHPYAAYDALPTQVHVEQEGDANARSSVRIGEIDASITLIQSAWQCLRDGPVAAPCYAPPLSAGLGWVEGPRGTLLYAVHMDADGRLARVKIKSPSFSNWRAFPTTVHDTNIMDYAINEASFGLTIAGCAR